LYRGSYSNKLFNLYTILMNPLLQQADNLFSQVVGTSAENLMLFVTGNENIVAVRNLTKQYLTDVATTLGVTPPASL
jgi:hypothetical protein